MDYIYDGSIEGLFTVIFNYYKNIDNCNISPKSNQINFISSLYVSTEYNKFILVKKSILKNFGNEFYNKINIVFHSNTNNVEIIIAKVIKGIYKINKHFINSIDKNAVIFNKAYKNVIKEIHSYQGLMRFKTVQQNFLYAEFEPDNDILHFISYHFKKRYKNEKFIIFDKKRRKCAIYLNNKIKLLNIRSFNINETEDEDFFENCWIEFYKSVCIENRKNLKLLSQNMPKKYWKYLPERKNKNSEFKL